MFIFKKLVFTEWFRGFFSASFVLYLIITVANLISGFMRSSVTPMEVMVGHLIETPAFLNMILPIACLVASMFSIHKLKSRNELTAIFASGYSRQSFVTDIFQASLIIALFQFLLTSYLDPYIKRNREQLFDVHTDKIDAFESQGLSSSTIGSGKIWYRTKDYFFAFTAFDKNKSQIKDVSLFFITTDKLVSRVIQADQATYIGQSYWQLDNVKVLKDLESESFPSSSVHEKLDLQLNETADDFLQIEADITTLPIQDLARYIKKLEQAGINTGEYQVLYYNKFSSALICIIFSLIASIGIFNPNRRTSSFGQNIAFVFVFTLLYWLVYSYTLELGNSSKLHPVLACFAVPMMFSSFLIYFYIRNRKLR
jgi:lipopolysaccharide export system permease protein